MLGTVKFFLPVKFYGIVSTEGGEFFFHGTSVLGEIPQTGDEVSFWLADDPRGGGRLQAVEVKVRDSTQI